MKLNSQQIKFYGKVILALILMGFLVNAIIHPPRRIFLIEGINYKTSQINIEGLNQFILKNYPNGVILSYNARFIPAKISPNWEWIAYYRKDATIEFVSMQGPSRYLSANPQGKTSTLISWSPDGQTVAIFTYAGTRKFYFRHGDPLSNHTNR
jgi:hypothetical protein